MSQEMVAKGVLSDTEIRNLVEEHSVYCRREKIHDNQYQPTCLELRVGDWCQRIKGSFRGLGASYEDLDDTVADYAAGPKISLRDQSISIERDEKYVFALEERFNLPEDIWAHANPKSSIGRLNIQVKLLSNGEYDKLPFDYKEPVLLEVTSRSFNVTISKGDRLNQIRFYNKGIADIRMKTDDLERRIEQLNFLYESVEQKDAFNNDTLISTPPISRRLVKKNYLEENSLILTVDLEECFSARRTTMPIDVSRKDEYDASLFWNSVPKERLKRKNRDSIRLFKDEFYLFKTKETFCLPSSDKPVFVGEILPYDASKGEFRAHAAAFIEYGFGNPEPTMLVLEITPYETLILEDGQKICKVVFDYTAGKPDRNYGSKELDSHYQKQVHVLSKHFKEQTIPDIR